MAEECLDALERLARVKEDIYDMTVRELSDAIGALAIIATYCQGSSKAIRDALSKLNPRGLDGFLSGLVACKDKRRVGDCVAEEADGISTELIEHIAELLGT